MAHYQPDVDEPSIFGGVNDNPHESWMGWHRFKFKSEPAEIMAIGKKILKQLREEEPRNYPLPLLGNLMDYKGIYAPLSHVIEMKYRMNMTWEQADAVLLYRDSSDAFYTRLYHQNSGLTRRMHDLAASKGYDHMALAIDAAPECTEDTHASEVALFMMTRYPRDGSHAHSLMAGVYNFTDNDGVGFQVVVPQTGAYKYVGSKLSNV
jgi:hypothetical protein